MRGCQHAGCHDPDGQTDLTQCPTPDCDGLFHQVCAIEWYTGLRAEMPSREDRVCMDCYYNNIDSDNESPSPSMTGSDDGSGGIQALLSEAPSPPSSMGSASPLGNQGDSLGDRRRGSDELEDDVAVLDHGLEQDGESGGAVRETEDIRGQRFTVNGKAGYVFKTNAKTHAAIAYDDDLEWDVLPAGEFTDTNRLHTNDGIQQVLLELVLDTNCKLPSGFLFGLIKPEGDTDPYGWTAYREYQPPPFALSRADNERPRYGEPIFDASLTLGSSVEVVGPVATMKRGASQYALPTETVGHYVATLLGVNDNSSKGKPETRRYALVQLGSSNFLAPFTSIRLHTRPFASSPRPAANLSQDDVESACDEVFKGRSPSAIHSALMVAGNATRWPSKPNLRDRGPRPETTQLSTEYVPFTPPAKKVPLDLRGVGPAKMRGIKTPELLDGMKLHGLQSPPESVVARGGAGEFARASLLTKKGEDSKVRAISDPSLLYELVTVLYFYPSPLCNAGW